MIPTICFATNNANKLKEIREIVQQKVNIVSLAEIGCQEELPETGNTLAANSLQKAQYVLDHYGVNCFADDTGLEVASLAGEPGVYSARFAGPGNDSEANMNLLLEKLAGIENRKAQFRTVITLLKDGQVHQFEGTVKGTIAVEKSGSTGFGYDPLFIPEGHERTFAEMSAEEKNKISHRGRAVAKLVDYLNQNT